jgi:uncharacterized membrane protein
MEAIKISFRNIHIMNQLSQIVGHFHPLIVHLPIGILLLALVFEFLSRREKFAGLKMAVPLSFLLGAVSAAGACLTGYLLSQNGEYEGEILEQHQWLGIGTMVVSFLFYGLKKRDNRFTINVLSVLLLGGITATGHLGGTLTHGSDYLVKAFYPPSVKLASKASTTSFSPESVVFKDVIQPILNEKCESCHGANKQKGKLRLDKADFIFKGGETGQVLLVGKPDESEMIKRLLLPLNHEDHMPPKEKSQITPDELALLQWWITNGADIHKTVKDLPAMNAQNVNVKPNLNYIPDVKVEKPNEAAILALQKLNAVVVPIDPNLHFLSVSTYNVKDFFTLKTHLETLSKNIVWLKLSGTNLSDTAISIVSQLPNLTKLHVDNTSISDAGLNHISTLSKLVYLNLVGTKATQNGVLSLKNMPQLKQLFLYKTGIKKEEWTNLQAQMTNIQLDFGDYKLAFIPTDTQLLKPTPVKK